MHDCCEEDKGFHGKFKYLPLSYQDVQENCSSSEALGMYKKTDQAHIYQLKKPENSSDGTPEWCKCFCCGIPPCRPGLVKIMQWLLPFLCCGFCNLLMSFLLHLGTYEYIQVMGRFEAAYKLEKSDFHNKYNHLSAGLSARNASFGSLQDPIEHELGWRKMSLAELDMAALALPFVWFCTILWWRDIQMWTKTLLCHSFLAFFKGVLACITIVPDSIGWRACKQRLGDESLALFRSMPSLHEDFFNATITILDMEKNGYFRGKPVRFCADMLYSGHTFVTCLYGFALIELTRKTFIHRGRLFRMVLQICVSLFFGVEQFFEIKAVLLNRFHYTMDIVLAILMVLLWYTNGPLILAASYWSKVHNPSRRPAPSQYFVPFNKTREELFQGTETKSRFEFIPVSKKCSEATHKAAREKGLAVVDVANADFFDGRLQPLPKEMEELPIGLQTWANRNGMGLVSRVAMGRKDGDLWVPPACLPFSCCLLGRRHSIIANSEIETFDPHQMLPGDPFAWCPMTS